MEEAVKELISIFETIYEVKYSGKTAKQLPGNVAGYNVSITSVTGTFSSRHLVPDRHQNSRLPEGEQMFNINLTVCTLGTVSPFYELGNGGHPSEIQVHRYLLGTNLASRPFHG